MASFKMMSEHPWSALIPGFVRELGKTEKLMKVYNEQETYLLVQALKIVSKGLITTDLIHGALERLVVKIPCLKMTIVDHFPEPGAKRVPVFVEKPNMKIPLETKSETDWIRQIDKEWKRQYDVSEGPLWRVVHLPNVVLGKKSEEFHFETLIIFSFHHSIIDGMSYQRLFGGFLGCLEAVSRGDPTAPEPGKISLPADYYVPGLHGWKAYFKKMLTYQLLTSRFLQWLLPLPQHPYLSRFKLPIEEDPSISVERCFIPLEFSRSETSAIIEGCKFKGITVNGAVSAAAIIAFAQILEGEVLSKDISIDTLCAVSLRRLRKDIKQAYGMFACVLPLSPKVPKYAAFDNQAFWKFAKQCSESVHKMIKDQAYVSFFLTADVLLPLLQTGRLKIQDLATGPWGRNKESLCLTNMEYCDFLDSSPDANFKLVGRFGGDSEHRMGYIFTNNLNTFNGQMFWSVLYCKHIVHTAIAEQYAEYIRQILLRFTLPDTEL